MKTNMRMARKAVVLAVVTVAAAMCLGASGVQAEERLGSKRGPVEMWTFGRLQPGWLETFGRLRVDWLVTFGRLNPGWLVTYGRLDPGMMWTWRRRAA